MKVKVNPTYIPYLDKPQFTQIFFGGASSGKSFFLAQKIILDNLKGVNWLVCRKVQATIKRSVYNEIIKAIYAMELIGIYKVNKSDMIITNTHNNAQILFVGLDDVEKVKSITPQYGVLHRVFIEEATETKKEDYLQLKRRLRGNTNITKNIVMAFNPILKRHWIYETFFEGKWNNKKTCYEDDKVSILKTIYKDNKFLTQQDIENLEDESDRYFYEVYTLGNWGTLKGLVFKNFEVQEFDTATVSKRRTVRSAFGLDFGYTNDPTALFCGLVDTEAKEIYVFDELYQNGLINPEIAERIKAMGYGKERIIADSADPKSIDELYELGLRRIQGASKNKIVYDIQKLRGYKIIIHPRCINFTDEINQYAYATDRNGMSLNKPIDDSNHLMDAMRYAVVPLVEGSVFSFE